jgi:[ribosomal protein S5]-alanine N-acetyltransferase
MEDSENIRLEPVGYQHMKAIQALASDPAIGETSSVPSPYPHDGARTWISRSIVRRCHGVEYSFAVLVDDQPIGVCGVVIIGENRQGGEIGYWIGRPYWNRGFASEACRLLMEFCFVKLRLLWLSASVLERNAASAHVLQKIGFSFIGRGVNPNWKSGPQDPFSFFSLTRDDWQQTQQSRNYVRSSLRTAEDSTSLPRTD